MEKRLIVYKPDESRTALRCRSELDILFADYALALRDFGAHPGIRNEFRREIKSLLRVPEGGDYAGYKAYTFEVYAFERFISDKLWQLEVEFAGRAFRHPSPAL